MTQRTEAARRHRRPGRIGRGLSDPRAPFRPLALVLSVFAFFTLVLLLNPGMYAGSRGFRLAILGALLVSAALSFALSRSRPPAWAVDVAVLGIGALAGAIALGAPASEGQLLVGSCLVVVGIFAGYFRPPLRAVGVMAVVMLVYWICTELNSRLTTPMLAVIFCAIVLGATYLVAALAQELRRQTLQDPLTGLLNRRGLEAMAPALVAGARRADEPVTVAVVDVDRFKEFNDTYGHLAGDAMLRAVAAAWAEVARDSDLVVRYGGDELVLVLVGAARADALEVCGRAGTAFEARRPEGWAHGWSVGLATLDPAEPLEPAIERADAELLGRKRTR